MEENLKIFGERLRALRLAEGMTQKKMAERLGCTTSNYQKMEYGQVNVPALTLIALADHYGVTLDYLVGRSDKR